MVNQPVKEGEVAKAIEKQTAKIPSDVYLWAALGSMAVSLALFATKKKQAGVFFGQWAPSLLIMGLYNKLVKLEGHDKQDKGEENTERERHLPQKRLNLYGMPPFHTKYPIECSAIGLSF